MFRDLLQRIRNLLCVFGTKVAATIIGLSRIGSFLAHLPGADSSVCQIMFDQYEECLKSDGTGSDSCHYYLEMMALCPEVNKDPGRRTIRQKINENQEILDRMAIKAGFSDSREYGKYKSVKNPIMCRSQYELYNKCLSRYGHGCEVYRNECPQFEQAPKSHAAVDSTP